MTVVQSMIQPERDAIKAHLDALFAPAQREYPGGLIELRYGPPEHLDKWVYFSLQDRGLNEAADFAARVNNEGSNVYVGVNPRRPGTNFKKASTAADVEIAFYHFADIDKAESVIGLVERYGALPPTMTITTGSVPNKRPHLYWRLEEPVMNMAEWSERQRGLAQRLGGDAVIDPPRIMRLGGTVNFPTPKKLEKGYKVELTVVRTEFATERADVTPDQIRQAYPYTPSDERPEASASGKTTLSDMASRPGLDPEAYISRVLNDDSWHNNYRDLVAHWVSIGWADSEILLTASAMTMPGYTVPDTEKKVREYIRSARLKYNVPEPVRIIEPVADGRTDGIRTVDAFAFDEASIPPRPWIIPGVMLARHTHMLVAPGGSGKSLFTLQLAIMLATGQSWGGWTPKKRCKTLIINVEDDIDEQRRRLAAARSVMKPDPELTAGMIHLAEEPDSIVVARVDPKSKTVVTMPMAAELRRYIEENDIDVLIVDPFAETFEGDENSNSEAKWAMKVWRDEIARTTGCAVYLVHHTVKYASGGAGNADVIRGAGAIVNSTRISSTLFTMTEDEAKAMGVPVDERNLYVRYDDAKANQTLKATAKWFEKISVTIGNGNGFSDPDEVGALSPWSPPDALSGCTNEDVYTALLLIERGVEDHDGRPSGTLFTKIKGTAKGEPNDRWVGHPIMAALGVNEERAALVAKDWIKNGMLIEDDYFDEGQRKKRKGLRVSEKHKEGLTRG